MSEKPDRGRKALEIGADAAAVAALVVDVGATGGVFVGAKLLWDVMAAGVGRYRRKQAEEYLGFLADALQEGEVLSLAAALDQAGDNRVWETLGEGFRAMMGAIDETAKRCIALLVADYYRREDLPDREFRLLGDLLAASDEPILRTLRTVTSQFTQVYVESTDSRASRPANFYGIYRGHSRELQGMAVHALRRSRHGKPMQSLGELRPDNLTKVARLLERHEIGEIPEAGEARLEDRERPNWRMELRVDEDAARLLRRLHAYVLLR
jgi:hypothetical protein